MKSVKYLLLVVLLWPLGSQAAQYGPDRDREGQYGRARDQRARSDVERLDNVARELADRADRVWNLVRNRRDNRGQQNDIYKALHKFAQNTRKYSSRVNKARSDDSVGARQLIAEAENISRLVDRTETAYQLRDDWNTVEQQVARLSHYYGLPFSGDRNLARTDPYYRGDDRYRRNSDTGYQPGIFRWRGRVDGSDIIYLRRNRVDIRHLQAQSITGSSYDLPSPLPRTEVNAQLRKLRGRGQVQIVQQPSSSNDYTMGVMIEDKNAGADSYEFELAW